MKELTKKAHDMVSELEATDFSLGEFILTKFIRRVVIRSEFH